MSEAILFFLTSGVLLTIMTLFWRKSVLSQKFTWFLQGLGINCLMYFISCFFSPRVQEMMLLVHVLIYLMLVWMYIGFWGETRNNEKRIKNTSLLWIGASWVISGYCVLLLFFDKVKI